MEHLANGGSEWDKNTVGKRREAQSKKSDIVKSEGPNIL